MSLYSSILNPLPGAESFIRSFPLFAGLSQEQIARVAQVVQHREFAAGIILFHQDMPGSRMLYMIEAGWVRVYSLGRTGQELTLTLLSKGDLLGEMSLMDNKPHSATAITLTPISVWLLHRTDLDDLLERIPNIAREIMKVIVSRMRAVINRAESLAFQDVQGRLAYEMLTLAQRHGKQLGEQIYVDLPLTQADLASMVGATRESVNKALSALRSQNFVKLDAARVTVLSMPGLQRIVYERGR